MTLLQRFHVPAKARRTSRRFSPASLAQAAQSIVSIKNGIERRQNHSTCSGSDK
jgi:hypothetical protein